MKQWIGLLAALFLLTACGAATLPPVAQQPLYVLSGYNVGDGFRQNALTIMDRASQTPPLRVSLPRSWAKQMGRDPQGRIWIGFSGNIQESDDLVQIYSPQGELLKELHPCTDPEAGISFARQRAFIACADSGLQGKVAVVNLETLAIETMIELRVPDGPLILTSSAATEDAVVVAGLTSGSDERSHSVVSIIDPRSLTVQSQLRPGSGTDIWRILPFKGQFYLLNVASQQAQTTSPDDLLLLTPGPSPTITAQTLAAAPLWGAITGDLLYTYHNPTWNQPNTAPSRQLARMNLRTGQVQTWPLPDQWNAADLAIVDGQIMLAKWDRQKDTEAGVYRFDPQTGQLVLLYNVADASMVLAAP